MQWKTKDGQVLDIKDMTTQHLINAIAYLKNRNDKGVELLAGAYDIDTIHCEIDHQYFDNEIEEMQEELKKKEKMYWKCIKCKFINPDEEDVCLVCGIGIKEIRKGKNI